VSHQHTIARLLPDTIDGGAAVITTSAFGHDGFLIEDHIVGGHLARLLNT
jgi:homoserine O-acetyltransferase